MSPFAAPSHTPGPSGPRDADALDPTDTATTGSPWNGLTLPQVFADAAAAHPHRIAIDDGVAPVTYGELSVRVDRVAAEVGSRLNGAGRHVAVLAEPGPDALAAMLGTMKAGHAYVPLDPDDPPERLRMLLDDAEARVLLADRGTLSRAATLAGDRLEVVSVADPGADADASQPCAVPDPDAVAFLAYTSGSTGRPKGVLQTHRARLHATWHYSRFHDLGPDDRVALLFSLSFGASSLVVYASLLNGATLCLPNLKRRGVAALAAWLDAERITMAHSVPGVWRALLGQPVPAGRLGTLRTFDLGGEAVFPQDVAAWRTRFGPGTRLTTRLAATEVSLITQCEIGDVDGASGPITVGTAAPGVRLTIMRDESHPAAAGEAGEIIVHSPYVSPGYWRLPELTAARFADDPDRPGWRVYRGGDRGLLDAEGRLTVLGRADAVVRVRGYSVHLAEVEVALRRVDGVEQAAVVAVDEMDVPGADARIVAFVTGAQAEGRRVRRALASVLPRYAVPAEVHRVDALPMTVTGKVDRGALARMGRPATSRPASGPPALDDHERMVAALVARILHLPDVARDENLFDLGIDSMSLAVLHVELERMAGRSIAPADLLNAPNVASLAALLRVPPPVGPTPSTLLWPVRSGGTRPPLFLVHGGSGRVVGSQALLDALGDDQPVWGFRAPTTAEHQPPLRTIPDMASAYVDAMRRVQPSGPYYVGGLCAGAVVATEMACQLHAAGERVAPVLLIDPPRLPRDRGHVEFALKGAMVRLVNVLASSPFNDALLAPLRRLGLGTPNALGPEGFGVWARFRLASYRHTPTPYEGPAHVLISQTRVESTLRSWRRHLTGDVEVHDAGRSHRDVFDPSNHVAAAQLRLCVDRAVEWMRRAQSDAARREHRTRAGAARS